MQAADAGSGRAALRLYHELKDTDLALAGYYVRLAFKDMTPGSSAALLNFQARAGAIQKTRPNEIAGTVVLNAYHEHPNFGTITPPELNAYELPHAAVALARLDLWDGNIPEMGELPEVEVVNAIYATMENAMLDPKVRSRIRANTARIGARITCDAATRTCGGGARRTSTAPQPPQERPALITLKPGEIYGPTPFDPAQLLPESSWSQPLPIGTLDRP